MKNEMARQVLYRLHRDRIKATTKEQLVKAFHDDGIADLESVAERMLQRMTRDWDQQEKELLPGHYGMLKKMTSRENLTSIVHKVPRVPFVLEGITYDPKDITRFNGEALVFAPVIDKENNIQLHTFKESVKSVIADYSAIRSIGAFLNIADFNYPGQPPQYPPGNNGGSAGSDPQQTGCGFLTGIPCGKPAIPQKPPPPPPPPKPPVEPPAPYYAQELQMFDDANYSGNWFWLSTGFIWRDLTKVSRGGWFGGDWNDEISSICSTNTTCCHYENVNLEGSMLFLAPFHPVHDLSLYGFDNRISSVYNIRAF